VGSDSVSTGFRDYLMNGSNSVDPLTAAQILDVVGWGLANLTGLGVTVSGALVDAWNTANSATVKKTCYEAGQSLFGAQSSISGCTSGDGPNYAGSSGLNGDGLIWEGALERANRHPRMTNLMYGSMKQCLDAGYTHYGEFTCDGTYTMFGYWGCREFFGQVVGPGNGTGGSFDNRTDLNSIALCEAIKLYAMQQWALA
jgi:hypothetical protein